MSVWLKKGATLSDKNVSKEFGFTQEEIIAYIKLGKLQYRQQWAHGNPYYKLIREEVEAVVIECHGENFLKKKKLTTELNDVNKEIRKLKSKIKSLEKHKVILLNGIEKL